MAEPDNRDQQLPVPQDGENYNDSGLVDVFGEDDMSDTRRVSPEELRELEKKQKRRAETEEDIDIEERDYRPVRTRRD